MTAIITGEWIDLPCIVNRFIPSFCPVVAILVSAPITFARFCIADSFRRRFKSILGVEQGWKTYHLGFESKPPNISVKCPRNCP